MQLMSQLQNHDQVQLGFLGFSHGKLSRQPPRNILGNPSCSLLQVHNSSARSTTLALRHLSDAITQLVILLLAKLLRFHQPELGTPALSSHFRVISHRNEKQ